MFMWTQFAHFQNILEDTRDTGGEGGGDKDEGGGDEEEKEGGNWGLNKKIQLYMVSRRKIKLIHFHI
jgi:hypothetical protein